MESESDHDDGDDDGENHRRGHPGTHFPAYHHLVFDRPCYLIKQDLYS